MFLKKEFMVFLFLPVRGWLVSDGAMWETASEFFEFHSQESAYSFIFAALVS
jgi:hypothetical protein